MTTVHLFAPQELYRHWEEGQWSPFEIDLAADAEQWRAMDGEDRSLIFWVLSRPRARSPAAGGYGS